MKYSSKLKVHLLFLCSTALFGQTQILTDIDGEAGGDHSGNKVSITADGTRIAIAAEDNLGSQGSGTGSGNVRVYDYNASGWVQVGTDINGEGAGDLFGSSVSISDEGSRIAIGGDANAGNGTRAGHVRIYEYSSGSWSQLGSDIDGEATEDQSGYSVSLSGDGNRIAIGARFNDGAGNASGHVRIYEYSSSSWSQLGSDINGQAADDYFGASVSIDFDGSRLAVGAPRTPGVANAKGYVRIYEYNSGSWSQLGSNIAGESSDDHLGQSVSIDLDGDHVAIGAPGKSNSSSAGAGYVRIFKYEAGSWIQKGSNIQGEAAGDNFGHSVSIDSDGDHLAIGGRYYNEGLSDDVGHARVYKFVDNNWITVGLDMYGEVDGDRFGSDVALDSDGDRIAIGGPLNDASGTNAGHVRVYDPFDNNTPSVVITAAEGLDGFSSNDATLSLTFTTSEPTNTFAADDIILTNGVISNFSASSEYSLSLDGDDDHVEVSGLLGNLENITLAGWAKTSSTTRGEVISIGDYVAIRFESGNQRGFFYKAAGGWSATIFNSPLSPGWHYFTYTNYDSSSTRIQKLYIDGNEVVRTTYNTGLVYSGLGTNTRIGMHGNNNYYSDFNGNIDEVAVWRVGLTAAEVTALYNSGISLDASSNYGNYISSSSLVGYWKFNEGTGTSVNDASGNNNNGVFKDNASWDTAISTVYTATLTPIDYGWVTIDVEANRFLDLFNNYNSAADQFNWFYDNLPPIITFSPLNGSVGVALNTNITLTFDEPIRLVDNSEITNSNVDALLRLKTPIHSGTDIPFEATIDADKKVITINPTSDLAYTQTVWVGIGESVEDSLNHLIFSAAASFTTTDTNRTPVLYTYSNQTTFEDVAISLILMATDLDDDSISFSVSSSESNVTPLITDSLLTLTPSLNWHGQSTITVTATDNNETPSSQVKTFTLTVRPVNDAPSGVTFSPDSIRENLFPGTFVGTILATDVDTGETFIYDMVSGNGVNDRDNDKFLIVNDSLLSNTVFDYEKEDTLFIRLLVRDSGGLTSELSTQVYVIDTPDPILVFSTTTLSYGKVIITQSSKQTLTLSSTGTDTVIIDSISQVSGGYSMSAQTYPIKIAPNLTKDFTFTFAPVDTGSSVDQAIFYPRYITGLNRVVLDGRAVHDTIPPIITTPIVSLVSAEAKDVPIVVPVVDDNLITNVTLHYLVGGNSTVKSQEATANGDGTYSATINKDFIGMNGLAYYHTAEDEYSNIGISDTSAVEVNYVAGRLDSKISGTAYPKGIPKNKWRLISVPTNLDFNTVNETLGDELGDEGTYSWKLYEDLGNGNWQETQDIKLGNGYWLNQRKTDDLSFGVGSGKSVDIRSHTIMIPKGWSLIGNPYPFSVKVNFNNSEVFGPLTYGTSDLLGEEYEGWDAETKTLLPWEGYAVYNRTSDSLDLVINPLAEDAVSSSAVTDGWHINLGVDNGKFSDHYNIIGRRSDASDKLDQWDNPEPPKLEEYLSLSMDRKEWGVESPLTSDVRSMDESNGQWEMYLDTKGIKGTVYLEANIKGDFPLESSAVLFDPIERKRYDLLMDQSIMITRVNDHYDYPLTVLVGSPDYVLAKTEELIAQLPESFTLGQNYPNPFNPETNIPFTIAAPAYVQIAIFNLMGQRVATLESRWFDMGQYSVRWNGKDAQGNQLSTGVYIYSLESAQFRQAKKLILVK